jgi:hypothetical protein
MTAGEGDIVAEELTTGGGPSGYPGREQGRLLTRLVIKRYHERAKAVIATLGGLGAGRVGRTIGSRRILHS